MVDSYCVSTLIISHTHSYTSPTPSTHPHLHPGCRLHGMAHSFTFSHCLFVGESLPCTIAHKIRAQLPSHTKFINSFGQMESTLIMTYYDVTMDNIQYADYHNVPLGRPFPGYSCILLDPFQQPVFPGQVGELFIHSEIMFKYLTD